MIETYDSGRPELRLAAWLKSWTDRDTGIELHTSLKPKRLEPRFDITLDRATHRWARNPRVSIPNRKGATGWVFVAAVDAFSEDERAAWAAKHPYSQYGDYFALDLRESATRIEAWALTPSEPTARWWLFDSAFEPPLRATRAIAAEQTLRRKVAELDVP